MCEHNVGQSEYQQLIPGPLPSSPPHFQVPHNLIGNNNPFEGGEF